MSAAAWAERVADLTAERDRARRIAVALDGQLARVEALFAGGPDTVCQTVWRNDWGVMGHIECVEVPMDDLRAALEAPDA